MGYFKVRVPTHRREGGDGGRGDLKRDPLARNELVAHPQPLPVGESSPHLRNTRTARCNDKSPAIDE